VADHIYNGKLFHNLVDVTENVRYPLSFKYSMALKAYWSDGRIEDQKGRMVPSLLGTCTQTSKFKTQ